jgi:uncharacterized membrane-anchored protein YitT (DUF2179 family)
MPGKSAPFRPLIPLLAALFLVLPLPAFAHDIPIDVTVQMFVKPAGKQLHVLVRVPLRAMRDFEFPERGPGYLDLTKVDPFLHDAATLWLSNSIEVYEGSSQLLSPQVVATRISLESDRSFDSYEDAFAHVTGPKLANGTEVFWDQTMMDVLFDYPIQSDQARFSIHPGLGGLAVHVVIVLRFLPPGGAVRAFEFLGDPGLVRLDPRWHQTALRFVKLGFLHILDGADHLLFLFCLVIPFRRFRALIPVVTAFTVAHSITLIASAYNLAPDALWFPPLIETLIAVSIVYMALENIVGGITVQHRWIIAFCFGLVHGFGFSFILRETLQFAGAHLLTSLLSFNVGVELGQLLVLALLIPVLELLFRFAVPERMGTIILSAIVAHTAWHWMIERAEILSRFQFKWPQFNAAWWASAMHALIVSIVIVGLGWLTLSLIRQYAKPAIENKTAPADDRHA